MNKQRTVAGAYSEEFFGDDGVEKFRNCDIGPEPMNKILNLSETWLEKNSDFSRAAADQGRCAGHR
jgi:hypothetical protein